MKLSIEIDLNPFEKHDSRTRHYELQRILELINDVLIDMRRDEEGRWPIYDLKNNPIGVCAVASETETERLKAGRFTPEEFQNLCHNVDVQNGFEAFAAGCAEFQRNLFRQCDRDNLAGEIQRLHDLIHTPHTDEFMTAVPLEAAFQIDHWGVEHDAGKKPEDFFWLIGYLAGKALRAVVKDNDVKKAKHHTISTAAVCLNWFRRISGEDQSFQPGTDQKL